MKDGDAPHCVTGARAPCAGLGFGGAGPVFFCCAGSLAGVELVGEAVAGANYRGELDALESAAPRLALAAPALALAALR